MGVQCTLRTRCLATKCTQAYQVACCLCLLCQLLIVLLAYSRLWALIDPWILVAYKKVYMDIGCPSNRVTPHSSAMGPSAHPGGTPRCS